MDLVELCRSVPVPSMDQREAGNGHLDMALVDLLTLLLRVVLPSIQWGHRVGEVKNIKPQTYSLFWTVTSPYTAALKNPRSPENTTFLIHNCDSFSYGLILYLLCKPLPSSSLTVLLCTNLLFTLYICVFLCDTIIQNIGWGPIVRTTKGCACSVQTLLRPQTLALPLDFLTCVVANKSVFYSFLFFCSMPHASELTHFINSYN